MSLQPKILLLGANGQVGTELQRSFASFGELIACDRTGADLSQPESLRELIRRLRPDIILNAAAYTAVDRAESEQELAMAINGAAPRILAEEAARTDALLVHYSTDYVFDGTKQSPWIETDATNPLNVYGASKLAGERAIQSVGGRYLIFRTSWVYGPHGKNFLFTMLRFGKERDQLRIVDDQFGAPTSSSAIAGATRCIVDKALTAQTPSGIYHLTCSGETTWFGFAQAIFDQHLIDRSPLLTAIPSSEYPVPAARPRNSVLCNEKLKADFSVELPEWHAGLQQVSESLR
jgi:dTDP-4-dehydrorhamnose reductase